MKYQIKAPAIQLRPYVKHLVISESDDIFQNYLVLPDTSLVIGFQYSGKLGYIEDNKQFVLSDAGITGLLDAYRTFQSAPSTGTVLVVFTELGASSFLRLPLNELFQQSLSLEHFFTWQQISEMKEKLLAARTDEERIQVVELFLISNLREQRPYPLVQGALEAIQQ